MRSLAVASRFIPSECINSIIYGIMVLSVTRVTVTVPLLRNVDVARSELPYGEWIVINLFVVNSCHLANML